MHGTKRVIVFCTLTAFLPITLLIIPLYLRHNFYANVAYAVTESDILEIDDGISTIFCSEHSLRMNTSFNAFQMSHKPEITSYRRHIRLKKSMNLPDDTLEYWGFYLLKGATVALSVCSRFPGASVLAVKGERNLRTCGMLEHNNNKQKMGGIFMPEADRQVKIIFESSAQEIISNEQEATIAGKGARDQTLSLDENAKVPFLTAPKEAHLQRRVNGEDERLARRLRHAKKIIRDKGVVKAKGHKGRHTRRHKRRHRKHGKSKARQRKKWQKTVRRDLEALRSSNERWTNDGRVERERRVRKNRDLMKPPSLLDQGIKHGGNAARNSSDDESSVSSFEMGLFDCYEGEILIAQEFAPSDQCVNVSYLLSGKHMQTRHNVQEDGYYYYIFYSDNDIVSNDIHALFDIYKPTFQYENVTKACINKTECSFTLKPMSLDRVIVEIPTRDGIEHELDDYNLLISVCHPRMETYMIFPIAVLFFILGCAFL